MAMLPLPRFTIAFLVWLFSTPMVLNVQIDSQAGSPPPKQYQPLVNPKVDTLPSSLIQSSFSSSSLSRDILQVSN